MTVLDVIKRLVKSSQTLTIEELRWLLLHQDLAIAHTFKSALERGGVEEVVETADQIIKTVEALAMSYFHIQQYDT